MKENSLWEQEIWQKYRNGTASKKELEQLQAYLQQQDKTELEALFSEEGAVPVPADLASRIRAQLQRAAAPEVVVMSRSQRIVRRMAAAAVLLAAIAGAYYLLRWKNVREQTQLAYQGYDSIVNTTGAPRLVQLPDATKVWLNKRTTLYISTAYARQRQVKLTGEAYFDVVKNAGNPLLIQTGTIRTTVLGTAFNVDNSSRNAVRISLVQGRVQVSKQDATATPVLLLPGETATGAQQADSISTGPTANTDVTGWVRGHLVFNQLPLAEALEKAADYYGITIQADPALLQGKKVTTIYYKNQQWPQVLQHLLFMYQLTYTRKDNLIVISKP
ncbi:FecR family protein [Filimonas lacunae]|uniref:FecR family protein n=1 Tax=Filimonas lacunae TaxID=477680 RepID=A0A173MF16_9BACT|nr:FecR domain-containing protein [Filimonas lacunae]BAV06021.1 anti-sigma factor [Filimonas lacunae]SIT24242.1 FecR family protein [Filimonas lacunae]